ncbi:hypothetical protein GYMLUDRAFT_63639 [Collybiopsis luxurians FD-317 M1]|uniref:Uncharacterized protein n=1 Tax=Collybiopsis luxurians FD-317 M1 TaxID=944289 RepID=A0A0D0CF65_9AGAR|nr:hypothetical protein GYMLUDRAFT_63639 [Collybiopsis luxurians FD-317 M1]
MTGPKKETKHSRYYAKKYKCKWAAELRASGGPREIKSSASECQLSSVGVENAIPMYQEYMTLRNNIDDWLNRAVPQFPINLSDLKPQFATHLLSGASLSSELHGFALGNGRARLVFELAPQMEIPQPSWGGSTLWVPQRSSISTDTIYERLLDLRARSNRLKKISQKMQRYDGDLIWRYEEVENCIQSARSLYTDWYTMLDDLEGDPTDIDLLMFLKEVSQSLYNLGQTLAYLVYILQKLPRKPTESPTESPTRSPLVANRVANQVATGRQPSCQPGCHWLPTESPTRLPLVTTLLSIRCSSPLQLIIERKVLSPACIE